MTYEDTISPTPERLRQSPHWDTPEVDAKTNRRAYRVLDDVTRAWRAGKIEFAHFQAWEHFHRHWEGAQNHDVRVTDTTGDPMGCDDRMPAWQFHGSKLAQARSTLTPSQFQALELMCQGWGFGAIGRHFSPYKARQHADGYALGKIEAALDSLAYVWSLKLRQKVPIR